MLRAVCFAEAALRALFDWLVDSDYMINNVGNNVAMMEPKQRK
jgi:phage antirepressor YoqD-like protein